MKYNLSHINSLKRLQKEQELVRQRIKDGENELRLKMYEIPGELAAAGANTMIPRILRGKLTNAALNTGKKLINGFFSPSDPNKQNLLTYATKKPSVVVGILKKGFNLWRGKK
jgi:hypothetical protein